MDDDDGGGDDDDDDDIFALSLAIYLLIFFIFICEFLSFNLSITTIKNVMKLIYIPSSVYVR